MMMPGLNMDKFVSDCVITNSDDAIDDIWNVYNSHRYPDRKRSKFTNKFIS